MVTPTSPNLTTRSKWISTTAYVGFMASPFCVPGLSDHTFGIPVVILVGYAATVATAWLCCPMVLSAIWHDIDDR